MILAAAFLQVSAATFAPPEGVALRIVSERVQDGARQYRMERMLRFRREPGGYRAEVRLITADSTTADRSGSLFEAGFGALANRDIVFHLGPDGAVLTIDEQQALWDAFCARVAETAAAQRALAPASRDVLAQRIAAPLRAMPAERQRELLASLVGAAVAENAGEPLGVRQVRVPGTSPAGQPVTLEGTRRAIAKDDMIETETQTSAPVSLPAAAGAPAGSARVEIVTRRIHDPRTGLIVSASETTRTITASGTSQRMTSVSVERAD